MGMEIRKTIQSITQMGSGPAIHILFGMESIFGVGMEVKCKPVRMELQRDIIFITSSLAQMKFITNIAHTHMREVRNE